MDNRISKVDKISIYRHAGIKALRGELKKPFLKRTKGLLMIGKGVQITHGKHITCGRRVKFEDYAEIDGLNCRSERKGSVALT